MSISEFLDDYWGDTYPVSRNSEPGCKANPFDEKVATLVVTQLPETMTIDWEDFVGGYNFYPEIFAAGTLFKYDLERLKAGEGYKRDQAGGVLLPTQFGNRLFVPIQNTISGKVSFQPVAIECDPLRIGSTTESRTKGGLSTKERLNSLRVSEAGVSMWEEERKRLMGTFKGRLLSLIQS